MRVLQLTTHLNIGGISNYILSLSKSLRGKGLDCLVLSSGGNLEEEFRKNDIDTRRLDIRTKFEFGPKVLRSISNVVKMIRNDNVDIIHAHTRVSQALAFFASRIAGIPYVTTCHGFFKKRFSRRLFDLWGEMVIAISEPVKYSLINDFRVAPRRIEVIYNGIDLKRFTKEYSRDELLNFKTAFGFKEGPIVGTIGRLSPIKGHKVFIEAIKDVVSKGYLLQGIIMGDGPEEMVLKNLIFDLGMKESFQILKSDSDTPKYLAIMDIFVFPSIEEGLGLSLLEAMAKGLACIASDVGGISDIIEDGETGILFPVGDVKALSDSILRLLNDDLLKRRFGENAKRSAGERFSSEIMASKVLNLYRKVLEAYAN